MDKGPGRWTPAEATKRINACALSDDLDLVLTAHVGDQLADRDLIMGDLLHLLRRGFVYDQPEETSRPGYFKYRVEGKTPNSEGRSVRVVVIPSGHCGMKIVTIMWRDER